MTRFPLLHTRRERKARLASRAGERPVLKVAAPETEPAQFQAVEESEKEQVRRSGGGQRIRREKAPLRIER